MEWNTLLTASLEGLDKPQWQHIDILWASPAAGMMPSLYSTAFMCVLPPGGSPNAAGMCNQKPRTRCSWPPSSPMWPSRTAISRT